MNERIVRVRESVAADDPSLPGHFPSRPIVPGVVLLDRVASAALAQWPGRRLAAMPWIKFLGLLQPGQPFDIEMELDEERLRFHCDLAGKRIAQGEMRLSREKPP